MKLPAPDSRTPDPLATVRYRAALGTAIVAGVFMLAAAILLAVAHVHSATEDFQNSTTLDDLRKELRKVELDPAAEPAAIESSRQNLRDTDFELRQQMSERQSFARLGGWLLLAGAVVFVIAGARAAYLRKRLPAPRPDLNVALKSAITTRRAKWAVAGLAVVVVLTGAALGVFVKSAAIGPVKEEEGQEVVERYYPPDAEVARQWSRFRGPGGLGISAYQNVPDSWDTRTGKNILWKTEVPMTGLNSPVVWGTRIFMTGSKVVRDEDTGVVSVNQRAVLCFDTVTGELLWQQPVETAIGAAALLPVVSKDTGYAPATAATDGHSVYAIFANADVAAFDFTGKPLWTRNVGPLSNPYGHASSLELYKGLLIVQLDQGDVAKPRSAIMALDTRTGKTVWETRRPVPASWASPAVFTVGQVDQLITCAKPWVISYDPAKGTERWRAAVLDGEVAPSPVFGACLVFTVNAGAKLTALRPDGAGDVTDTAVVWSAQDGLPDITSPLTDGKFVWLLTTEGKLTCYSVVGGKMVYEKAFKPIPPAEQIAFKASPCLVGDKLYITEESGITHVLNAADGNEVSTGYLGEDVDASMAFQDGRIFIRGYKHLFAIGAKP
jgi:outer membrane protein assembly factor BamB